MLTESEGGDENTKESADPDGDFISHYRNDAQDDAANSRHRREYMGGDSK